MPLIAVQCANCGGALQVDSGAASYYCPFCNTAYAMEQTINQTFQTTNIEKATIIDDGSGKIDQEINSGEAFLTLRKFQTARQSFQRLTQSYAHKYRTWWGLARAITEEFTKEPEGKREFDCVKDAVGSAIQLAPADQKLYIQQITAPYLAKWQEHSDRLTRERSQRLNDVQRRTQDVFPPLRQQIIEIAETAQKKVDSMRTLAKIAKALAFIIGALIIVGTVTRATVMLPMMPIMLALIPLIIYVKKTPLRMAKRLNTAQVEIDRIEAEIKDQQIRLDNETRAAKIMTAWLER